MRQIAGMEDDAFKRYRRVIMVGAITDKLIRDMKEMERRKRVLDAFAGAEDSLQGRLSQGSHGTARKGTGPGNTVGELGAAEVHTAPSPAAGNATLGRKSTGGKKLNG